MNQPTSNQPRVASDELKITPAADLVSTLGPCLSALGLRGVVTRNVGAVMKRLVSAGSESADDKAQTKASEQFVGLLLHPNEDVQSAALTYLRSAGKLSSRFEGAIMSAVKEGAAAKIESDEWGNRLDDRLNERAAKLFGVCLSRWDLADMLTFFNHESPVLLAPFYKEVVKSVHGGYDTSLAQCFSFFNCAGITYSAAANDLRFVMTWSSVDKFEDNGMLYPPTIRQRFWGNVAWAIALSPDNERYLASREQGLLSFNDSLKGAKFKDAQLLMVLQEPIEHLTELGDTTNATHRLKELRSALPDRPEFDFLRG